MTLVKELAIVLDTLYVSSSFLFSSFFYYYENIIINSNSGILKLNLKKTKSQSTMIFNEKL